MLERFTDGARLLLVQAQAEARGLGHHYIGCEHLLLAAPSSPATARQADPRPGTRVPGFRSRR